METYVKLLKSDADAICDAVREKTGSEGLLTASQAAEAINNMTVVDEVTVIDCGTSTTQIEETEDET